jgi:hypothetical protein
MTPSEQDRRAAQDARINQAVAEDVAAGMATKAAVAEDVAVGMAAEADAERARADAYAAANARERSVIRETARERDTAVVNSALARNDARSSSFAFWLLLGSVAAVLLVGAIWYASRRSEPATETLVINRQPAAVPVAPTRPAAQTPSVVTVPVPVPAPAPAAPAAAAPAPVAPPRDQTVIIETPPAPASGEASGTLPASGGEGSGGATSGEAAPPASGATGGGQ